MAIAIRRLTVLGMSRNGISQSPIAIAQLREGKPRIEVLTIRIQAWCPPSQNTTIPKRLARTSLQIISMTMQPGEELIVGRRLREILNTARKQAKA